MTSSIQEAPIPIRFPDGITPALVPVAIGLAVMPWTEAVLAAVLAVLCSALLERVRAGGTTVSVPHATVFDGGVALEQGAVAKPRRRPTPIRDGGTLRATAMDGNPLGW